MSVQKIEENSYKIYDKVVAIILESLYESSIEEEVVRLHCFDYKNLEHLCILQIALMARDLFQFSIEVDAPWLEIICLNHKLHKNFDKIKRYKHKKYKNEKGINVPALVFKCHLIIKEYSGSFDLKDIYNAYYKGGK